MLIKSTSKLQYSFKDEYKIIILTSTRDHSQRAPACLSYLLSTLFNSICSRQVRCTRSFNYRKMDVQCDNKIGFRKRNHIFNETFVKLALSKIR